MTGYNRNELMSLIREQALQFGDFTLASGKKATFYLDCRRITMHARGANLVAAGMIDSWQTAWPDAVGGMAVGAVPITAAILTRLGHELQVGSASGNRVLPRGFFCRKEAKTHGKEQSLEGLARPGDRAMIVEDVVTTGGSSLQAIEQCEAFGLSVLGVTAIIDRLEGGREAFAEAGYPLTSLFSIRDFGIK